MDPAWQIISLVACQLHALLCMPCLPVLCLNACSCCQSVRPSAIAHPSLTRVYADACMHSSCPMCVHVQIFSDPSQAAQGSSTS